MKKIISTDMAPAAIGPYSQAVSAGKFLFVSGQLPLNPADNTLIEGTMAQQTERILQNITTIIAKAGALPKDIVKTTIFLQDLGDFAEVNGAYGKFFSADPPARSTVQVAALPLGARIEIEAVVLLG